MSDEPVGAPVGADVWESTGAERVILTERIFNVHGKVATTEGHLTLTDRRLIFDAEGGRVTQGGALAQAIVDKLADRESVQANIALEDVTRVKRTKHGFGKWVMDVEANGHTFRFVRAWKMFPGPFREALERAGRTVTEVGKDCWEIT